MRTVSDEGRGFFLTVLSDKDNYGPHVLQVKDNYGPALLEEAVRTVSD